MEGEIFTILNYVLGPGQQRVTLSVAGERMDIDMILGDGSRSPLVIVEYDSAYFHYDKEDRDLRKSVILSRWWHPAHSVVMRIREEPLDRLRRSDVRVPARADAATCARLVLLHLQHLAPFDYSAGYELMMRSYSALLAGLPLEREQVACRDCRRVEAAVRRGAPGPYLPQPRRVRARV